MIGEKKIENQVFAFDSPVYVINQLLVGVNVVFVVVPLVMIALLAFVLAGVVFYRKRLQYSV